jgi:hypothetical protein
VIYLLKTEKPESVEQLAKRVQEKYTLSEQEITKLLIRLDNEGKIHLRKRDTTIPSSLAKYISSTNASWYWITVALAAATSVMVFTIPENEYPLVYVRYVLGTIFVLWLPGYTFVKALFPSKAPIKTSSENLDTIERVALSAGMSLALVPIIGLILNYTPWGIRLTPITISLLALTLVFATAAVVREYLAKTKETQST